MKTAIIKSLNKFEACTIIIIIIAIIILYKYKTMILNQLCTDHTLHRTLP